MMNSYVLAKDAMQSFNFGNKKSKKVQKFQAKPSCSFCRRTQRETAVRATR
jgi:hypothetical protein